MADTVAGDSPWLGVVVNPTKFDDTRDLKNLMARISLAHSWALPRWYETTAEDPGCGQTQQAVTDGAAVICPLGGDGTVRAVAEVLAHTDTPMGLLPGGTGNLLARNLKLPVDDMEKSVEIAVTGRDRRIDVGWVRFDDEADEHIFLVMTGIGFDAEMMDAPEKVKKIVGWPAYVLSGIKNLFNPGFSLGIHVDERKAVSQHARSVLIGNCGTLTAGMQLMPQADVADGQLDVVVLAPRGVLGWLAVAGRVLTANRRGHHRLRRFTGRQVALQVHRRRAAEIDGDPWGEYRRLQAHIDPLALLIREAHDE